MEKDSAKNNSALAAYAEQPRDVRFAAQEPDEEVLLLLRQHIIVNLSWVLIFLFLLVVPPLFGRILRGTSLDPRQLDVCTRLLLVLVWYLFSFGYALLSFLSWFFNIYLVTNQRIIDMDYFGFLFYRLSEAELSQIQDVTYDISGLVGTLFNLGDVFIQTAAEKREFDFHKVPRPARIHDLITDLAQIYD